MSTLQLISGRADALVDLEGGRLASVRVDDLELLITEGDRPTRWGSFPMIPWCGRLPYGRLHFEGHDYELPLNSPPHANHGRTHLQLWSESGSGSRPGADAVATDGPHGEIVIETALVDPWPFGGRAVQRFVLTDDQLTVTAEVHADRRPMPAMAGWHPWFRRQLDRGGPAELAFTASAIYAVDDDLVPTGDMAPVPPPPWNACFVGVEGGPTITWPGALTLEISSTFNRWVIFTEPEHALCVEPQSGPPNEFHMAPRIVVPGTPLIGSMTLRWG